MKKQGFLKGSFILIASVIIAKIIAALFRIPLTNMLGGTGMGYFSSAYGLFMPVYAFFVTGMSTAAAKQTAEYSALGMHGSIKKFRRISLFYFSIIGLVGSLIIVIAAKPFAYYVIDNPDSYYAVLATAPAIFFGCVMSAYRGHYEGLRNMYPTAVSQVVEGIVKLAAGLFLCGYILNHADTIMMYFKGYDSFAIAAAGAVAGVSVSTMAGALYLIFRHIIRGDGISKSDIQNDAYKFSAKYAVKSLFSTLVPIAVGSLVTNLTSLIDLGTIIKCMNKAALNYPEYFSEKFSAFSETGIDGFANFAYGSFIGMSVTVFNLVPSVTNMFGKGVFPSITEAWTSKDTEMVQKHSEDVIKVTSFLAVPSGIGITALSERILKLLYPERISEIQLASDSLAVLGIGVIMLAVSYPVFSMLQATGRADIPVKIMLAGVAVKFIGNILFIPIPFINISGAGIATDLCYLLILVLSLYEFRKHTGIRLNVIKLMIPSFYCGILCAVTALLMADITDNTIISILCGGIIYLVSMYLADKKSIDILLKRK
ncbi:MAG: polysaccharide biosynthesis C-terminal domain-containing protein [Oscillospiraceae bacterium]